MKFFVQWWEKDDCFSQGNISLSKLAMVFELPLVEQGGY